MSYSGKNSLPSSPENVSGRKYFSNGSTLGLPPPGAPAPAQPILAPQPNNPDPVKNFTTLLQKLVLDPSIKDRFIKSEFNEIWDDKFAVKNKIREIFSNEFFKPDDSIGSKRLILDALEMYELKPNYIAPARSLPSANMTRVPVAAPTVRSELQGEFAEKKRNDTQFAESLLNRIAANIENESNKAVFMRIRERIRDLLVTRFSGQFLSPNYTQQYKEYIYIRRFIKITNAILSSAEDESAAADELAYLILLNDIKQAKKEFRKYIEAPTLSEVPITDEQIEQLLSTVTRYKPPVEFSEYIKPRIVSYIRDNWSTRPGQKPLDKLIEEMTHPCTEEWFIKNMAGQNNLNNAIEELRKYLETVPVDSKAEVEFAIQARIKATAEIFVEGFFTVLQDNLEFENGIAIGVKEVDRFRFGKCHEILTRQKIARNSVLPGEGSPEEAAARVAAVYSQEKNTAALRKKESDALTEAIDVIDVPLEYLPKKTLFSNPQITYIYQILMGSLREELARIFVTKNISEFKSLKEKYKSEIKSDCFKDFLLSTMNQIIIGKTNLSNVFAKKQIATNIVRAIVEGTLTKLRDRIEFLNSSKPLPVKFTDTISKNYAKCEASFQKVSQNKIIDSVLSLDTSNITIDKIQYYRGLIDAVRRWHFAEYKKADSPFRLAIDAVALKLTQRELAIQYESSTTGPSNRVATVRSDVENIIMTKINTFIESQPAGIKASYNNIRIGLRLEIGNLILGAAEVPPAAQIIEHIDSKCFQEYFIDYLTLFSSPMRENLDKKLVNPIITRIKELAAVIVLGFKQKFSDKMALKNKSITGLSDPEFKRKYPRCQVSLQQRYADSQTIARIGYSVLPSTSMFSKTVAQKVYNDNLTAIIDKINELLPESYNINAILIYIKSPKYKTQWTTFWQGYEKLDLSKASSILPGFISQLARGLVFDDSSMSAESSPATERSRSAGSNRSFFNITGRFSNAETIPESNLPSPVEPVHRYAFTPVASGAAEPVVGSYFSPGPLANINGGVAAAGTGIGPYIPRRSLANINGGVATGRPRVNSNATYEVVDEDDYYLTSTPPRWAGGRRSHKKSASKGRDATRRGRRAHVVLRGPRAFTTVGKKNSRRSARRTRRRSSS